MLFVVVVVVVVVAAAAACHLFRYLLITTCMYNLIKNRTRIILKERISCTTGIRDEGLLNYGGTKLLTGKLDWKCQYNIKIIWEINLLQNIVLYTVQVVFMHRIL